MARNLSESNTANYKVASDSAEQFENITNFVMNMTVKNSKEIYDKENSVSEWFGSMILKYVDDGLTEDDVKNLLTFVGNYNNRIDSLVKTDDLYKLKLYNMDENSSNSISFLDDITNEYIKLTASKSDNPELINDLINNKSRIKAYIYNKLFKNKFTKIVYGDVGNLTDIGIKKISFPKNDGTFESIDLTEFTSTGSSDTTIIQKINELNLSKYAPILINDVEYYYDGSPSDNGTGNAILSPTHLNIDDEVKSFTKDFEVTLVDELIVYHNESDNWGKYTYSSIFNNFFKISESLLDNDKREFSYNNVEYTYIRDGNKIIYTNEDGLIITLPYSTFIKDMVSTEDNRNGYIKIFAKDSGETYYLLPYSKKILSQPLCKNSDGICTLTEYYENNGDSDENNSSNVFNGRYKFLIENVSNKLVDKRNKEYKLLYNFNRPIFIAVNPDLFEYAENSNTIQALTGSAIDEFLQSYNDLTNEQEVFLSQEKILYSFEGNLSSESIYNSESKLKATETEKEIIESGSPILVFDLRFPANLISNLNIDSSFEEEIQESIPSGLDTTGTQMIAIQILYKEFNPEYANITQNYQIYLAAHSQEGWNDSIIGNFNTAANAATVLTKASDKKFRNISNSWIIKDFSEYDIESGEFVTDKTTKLYQYLYSNSYIARKAAESEIIAYYYGDNYISNNYGKYKYEREEIIDFLNIYTEVRNYYYRVLLNEAFINEKNYSTYEKFFITAWAIERFLTNRMDYKNNIDAFNREDIKNFLISYGMENLAEIMNTREFYSDEEMIKKLLKSYIQLVQNKGSYKSFEILKNILTTETTELEIYKSVLVNNNGNYGFIKIRYDDDNIIYALKQNEKYFTDIQTYTENDPYWNTEGTTSEILNQTGIQIINTKYIVPEFSSNISDNYYILRIFIALIDYIKSVNTVNNEVLNEKLSFGEIYNPVTESDDTLDSVVDTLKLCLTTYLNSADSNFISQYFTKENIAFNINWNEALNGYFDLNTNTYEVSINESKVDSDLYGLNWGRKNRNNVERTLIIESLNSLKFLYLLYKLDEDKSNENPGSFNFNMYFNNYLKSINSSFENKDFSEINIVSAVIEKILYLPIKILNGDIEKSVISSNCFDFLMNEIFYKIFFKKAENNTLLEDILYKDIDDFSVEDAANNIIKICNELTEQLSISFSIFLNENTENLNSFLVEVFNYFVSYLSEIYKVVAITEYNTLLESVPIKEKIDVEIETEMVDTFFYDEQLSINVTNNNSN